MILGSPADRVRHLFGVVALVASAACTSGLDEFEVATGAGTSSTGSGGGATNGSGGASATSTASGSGAGSGTGGATGGGGAAGATSTATGPGGAGGVAGSGGTAGTGGGGTEDCLDGVDNDGDGLADCADPGCQAGFECVDDAPIGWAGYVRVRTTTFPNGAVSPCPDGSVPLTFMDTPAGAAQCTACTCGGWSGGACAPAQLKCWDNSTSCGGSAPIDVTAPAAGCHDLPNVSNSPNRSCRITADGAVSDPGACPPSAIDFPNKTSFANQDDVCGGSAVGAGCNGNQVCVPKGGGDYTGQICIQKVGLDGCPGGWPNKIQTFAGAVDDRGCDACACGVSGTACSGGTYTIYDANACDLSDPDHVDVTTACANATGLLDDSTGSALAVPATPSGGSCTPGGGAAHGGVTPTDPISICCK